MTTTGKELKAFNDIIVNRLKKIANMPHTGNPQGKVGVVEDVPPALRPFEGRFRFRKFEKKAFDNPEGFIKALQRRGFKVLGGGAFSTVLHKEGSDKVIKVIRHPDGWINYIHWAAQIGEAGHFAPKVFSYKKIKGRERDFSVAVMEKLEFDFDNIPAEHALSVLPGVVWRAEKNEMAKKFTEILAPGLMDYLKKMGENWNIPIHGFDLHSGNLMVRRDGSFVIVDPVSVGPDNFERLRAGDFSPAVALGLIGFYLTRGFSSSKILPSFSLFSYFRYYSSIYAR